MLTVDAGNSRLKWALFGPQSELLRAGADAYSELAALTAVWGGLRADRAAYTCVAGEPVCRAVDEALHAGLAGAKAAPAANPRVASPPVRGVRRVCSSPAAGGVVNGYHDPSQLGADRWAALVGARRRCRGACLVVNAGTAVTLDALDPAGEFIGGFLLPGERVAADGLAAAAAGLRGLAAGGRANVALSPFLTAFPRDTAAAVLGGARLAAAAAAHWAYDRLADLTQSPVCVLLTGGAAWGLAPYLKLQAESAPHLVLEGIHWLALEAEMTDPNP